MTLSQVEVKAQSEQIKEALRSLMLITVFLITQLTKVQVRCDIMHE